MASIITATTTSGLTQSADNSGVLQLASGTGNLVTVPSVTGTAMVSGNMPAFSAFRSGTQTLTDGVSQKLQYNAENFDTANCFDSTTNFRFTPNVAGYYQINLVIQIVSLTSGRNYVVVPMVYKNGSRVIGYEYDFNHWNDTIGFTLSWFGEMNGTTDYLEAYAYFDDVTAGGTGGFSGSTLASMFSGFLVRAS